MQGEERELARRAPERWTVVLIVAAVLILTMILSPLAVLAGPVGTRMNPFPTATGPRVLRVGVSDLTAVTLNPHTITLVLEFIPVYNVYSTLATRDDRLDVAPDLASSWEVASDQLTWTFHLVPNAYFTDPLNPTDKSHPVTADDVIYSYEAAKNNNGSRLNPYVSSFDRIEKVDAYTVRIVTTDPYAAMDSTITTIPIFPKYLWGTIQDPVSTEPRPYPVGSGAMYYDPNSDLAGTIILHRNPNYFGDAAYCQKSRPDEVRIIQYTSSGTMIDDFGSGASRLDAIYNIPSASFVNSASLNQPSVTKIQVAGGFVGEVASNVMTNQLRSALVASGRPEYVDYANGHNNQILATNPVVRQAIAMSIDRAAIVRYAYQGLATVGDSLVPSSNPWHYDVPANKEFPFNTAMARANLNSAGWTYDAVGNVNPAATPLYKAAGADPLIFRLYAPDSHLEFEPAIANISVWLRQAGIVTTDSAGNTVPGYEVKLTNEMNSIWSALDYDIWLWDWVFSRISDPSLDVLQVQTTSALGVLSDNGYTDPAFDALYNQSLITLGQADRKAITDQMQQMLYDYASYILPYYANDLYAVTSDPTLGSGWLNWGDWQNYPGLTVDSSLPTLFFNVVAPDNRPPVISAFPAVEYTAQGETTLSVIASDPEAAPLTYTWDFGDGTNPATTTQGSVKHTFATEGVYQVKVRVADAEWPSCASMTATIHPAAANQPPVANLDVNFPVSGHGWVDESLTLQVTVHDSEGDPLTITWDFGDGQTATNDVTSTATDKIVTQTHTYSEAGDFTVNVTTTDGQPGAGHVQLTSATVPIQSRPTEGGPSGVAPLNQLINYGVPIGIVALILVAAAMVLVRRRSTRQAEERQEDLSRERPPPPP
jgi:peptide/nickel transport system substrate-binding protein